MKRIALIILHITGTLFFALDVFGQASICTPQYVPKPYQNCINAIPLCNQKYNYPNGLICGPGTIPGEIPSGSCLAADEKNTVWYKFVARTQGFIRFRIYDNNVLPSAVPSPAQSDAGTGICCGAGVDYDWALFNITGKSCADVPNQLSLQVACNYAAARGVTGMMNPNGTTVDFVEGAGGNRYSKEVFANIGDLFVLAVDNFTGGDLIGYTIDFSVIGPNQANIAFAPISPKLDTIIQSPNCANPKLIFRFTKEIDCASVTISDFRIVLNGLDKNITSIVPLGTCGSNGSKSFEITFDSATADSNYMLILADSITDFCGNVVEPDTILFHIPPFIQATIKDSALCQGSFTSVTAITSLAGVHKFKWFGDSIDNDTLQSTVIRPFPVGVYQYKLVAKLLDCLDSIVLTYRVKERPTLEVTPPDSFCFGDSVFLWAKSNIPNSAYRWESEERGLLTTDSAFRFKGEASEKYRITVRTKEQCEAKATTFIKVMKELNASFNLDSLEGVVPWPVTFHNTSTGDIEFTYWNLTDTLTQVFEPTYVFNTDGYRKISLRIVDSLGCEATSDTALIRAIAFLLPNVLTINGDQKNDNLFVRGYSGDLTIKVTNRWGQQVYSGAMPYNTYTPEANIESGIYFYYIEDPKNPQIKFTGYFSIHK